MIQAIDLMVGNMAFDKDLNSVATTDWTDFEFPQNLDPILFDEMWCRYFPFVCVGAEFGIWELRYADRLGCLKIFRVILLEEGGAFVVIEDAHASSEPKCGINLGEYKYVHEIQNVFYSLACRPLEVIKKEK